MDRILACIDPSAYANSVCDLAAWAAGRLNLPIELLHVVQRHDPVAQRRDLSGAIGLGAKSELLEELTALEAADAKLQVKRARALLAAGKERLRENGASSVETLSRHGGIVETIIEREAGARVVIMGKRGVSHEFAPDHLGSKVERVVRASDKPVLIASRHVEPLQRLVFAYDASPAAERAMERLANSPLFAGMPVTVVMAEADTEGHRRDLSRAERTLAAGRDVDTILKPGKAETVIADVMAGTTGALLVMGAYGHSPLRRLFVGSTTTAMLQTVRAPVLLVR
ncbi:MAG: universal stress protein [Pacificimonas sp.]|jgi:nucleotide-binding universal stress UspA family protein|nr:universal stress protein [Pacificimonas sp.]